MYSAIITGSFTILAVIVTWQLTLKREKSRFIQEVKLKEYYDIEKFYIELIASLTKTLKLVQLDENTSDYINDNSLITAKANLVAPEQIIDKLSDINIKMVEWSILYKKGLPTKIGDTGLGMISSDCLKFEKIANEKFPGLRQEIIDLIFMVKDELKSHKNKFYE